MSGMDEFFSTARRAKGPETKKEVPTSTPPKKEVTQVSIPEESAEDRKRYPERTFDKYVQKGARLREEDIDILKVFCSEITRAKRHLPYEYRSNKRITDNTVLRLLVQGFCERIEGQLNDIDFKGIQSEGELKRFIEETMKF
jgi:hypothetical protein